MKVLVIGLGSMGQRRIRLLQQYDNTLDICGVDIIEERRDNAENLYHIKTLESMEEIKEGEFDCAFVSTSPLSHADLIHCCLEKDMHVFTEINLISDKYEENIELAERRNKVLFISSTFLYREEIQYIGSMVKKVGGPMVYSYHVGQYLPDWHPWEDYRNYFVGDKRTNGCRELLAIELPWIWHTFGDIKAVHSISGKNTNLMIDYQDHFLISLEHENGSRGNLIVDVISRKPVRNLEIMSENLYLGWNGTPEGLFYYDYEKKEEVPVRLYDKVDRQSGYSNFIVENGYMHEIEAFFKQVLEGIKPFYDFEKDKNILQIIDEIGKGEPL